MLRVFQLKETDPKLFGKLKNFEVGIVCLTLE